MHQRFTWFFVLLFSCSGFGQMVFQTPSGKTTTLNPIFMGCESDDDPQACSEKQFLNLLSQYLHYPAAARTQTMEGSVLFQISLSAEGKIETTKILHDPGYNLGSSTKKALDRLAKDSICWKTEKPVLISMPVVFYFQNGSAWLRNLDQIFSEHHSRFANQEVSYKQLKKLLRLPFDWDQSWFLKHTEQQITSVEISIQGSDRIWTFTKAEAFKTEWLNILNDLGGPSVFEISWMTQDVEGRQSKYQKTLYLRKSYRFFAGEEP